MHVWRRWVRKVVREGEWGRGGLVRNLRWLGTISLRQWNTQSSIRFSRFVRFAEFYRQLYREPTFRGLFGSLTLQFLRAQRPLPPQARKFLLAAVAFCFRDNGITDDEIAKTQALLEELEGPQYSHGNSKNANRPSTQSPSSQNRGNSTDGLDGRPGEDGWELLIEREDFRMWRRPLQGHEYLCEYKCAGTYHDVSAAAFFVAQMDLDYRKTWDKAVIKLDVIDSDPESGSEVVHWITHFPRPMNSREYIYVRRASVDPAEKTLALCSKAVEHPTLLDASSHVRVNVYSSQMVIRSHDDFEQNGFDYVLTYCDDPKSNFPTLAYNYLVKYGVPGFVDKVYMAAKALLPETGGSSDRMRPPAMEQANQRIHEVKKKYLRREDSSFSVGSNQQYS